jgi:hypothetical protein
MGVNYSPYMQNEFSFCMQVMTLQGGRRKRGRKEGKVT